MKYYTVALNVFSPEATIIILLIPYRFIFGPIITSQINVHAELLKAKVFQNKHLNSVTYFVIY